MNETVRGYGPVRGEASNAACGGPGGGEVVGTVVGMVVAVGVGEWGNLVLLMGWISLG